MLLATTATINGQSYKLDALPDPADFRDYLFTPTLAEAPLYIELEQYLKSGVPVRDQGAEGSCIGVALSTIAHYLLRTRQVTSSNEMVSARMMYEMAKRYDEWEGEEYEGSSSRGAMKGWLKHGVCTDELWPYNAQDDDLTLTAERAEDALLRPLGAFFRVNPRDMTAMHSALAEVGVLFATANIHDGWVAPDPGSGLIEYQAGSMGRHAFVIVGYNQTGFWVQNSWSEMWGKDGYAMLTYDDWLLNAMDVWVARLGVPVNITRSDAQAMLNAPATLDSSALGLYKLRAHIVRIHRSGVLDNHGSYATFEEDIDRIFAEEIPAVTRYWQRRRLLLYAGGGLFSEQDSVERMSRIGAQLLQAQIYPIGFIWNDGLLGVMQTVMDAAMDRVAPVSCDRATECFMQDRLDTALEPHVRNSAARLIWNDVKEIGYRATKNQEGAARILLARVAQFLDANPDVEVHVLAHSAGGIFFAPLVQLMTAPIDQKIKSGPMRGRFGHGIGLKTCTLWAPAITTELFKEAYLPAIGQGDGQPGGIGRFALYTLTDEAERHDCCISAYSKSLLYLISNALEEVGYVPIRRSRGQDLLGLEACVVADEGLAALFATEAAEWILAPNHHPLDTINASRAMTHMRFEEEATLRSTVMRILWGVMRKGVMREDETFLFPRSAWECLPERSAFDSTLHFFAPLRLCVVVEACPVRNVPATK